MQEVLKQGSFKVISVTLTPMLCPKGKPAFASSDSHVSDDRRHQVVCWAKVFPLSATTASAVGQLSAPASPGLTDQLTLQHHRAWACAGEGAYLALIMNAFRSLIAGSLLTTPLFSRWFHRYSGAGWPSMSRQGRVWYTYTRPVPTHCVFTLLYL